MIRPILRPIPTLALLVTLSAAVGSPALSHGGESHAFEGTKRNAPAVGRVEVAPDVQRALGIKVATVEEQSLSTRLSANGRVEAIPGSTASINAPVAGRILNVRAGQGQSVRAGQVLVTLDSPEIRALGVEQSRTRAEAVAAQAQAQARLNLARTTYERERELVNLRISARKDLQVAEAEFQQAVAALAAARSRVNLSSAALTGRLAALGQNGVRARADGSIVLSAPITGTVVRQQVSTGEAVEPGRALFEVVNLERVWATAQIYEQDLHSVRVGEPVEVVTESYPGRTFRGRITSIDPTVDTETRTVGVRAVMANPGGLLKPGMFATLGLVTGSGAPVVVIPRSAVLEADGKTLVFVQNGSAFEPVEVTLGSVSGKLVAVKAGLFAGDQVVVERAFQLRAQSLKSDIPAEDSASGTLRPNRAEPTSGAGRVLPGWAWALGAVLLAALAFFAGTQVAGSRETAPREDSHYLKSRR